MLDLSVLLSFLSTSSFPTGAQFDFKLFLLFSVHKNNLLLIKLITDGMCADV